MIHFNKIPEVVIKAAEYVLSPPVGYLLPWWPKFTEYTGGLREHELTLLCAPTGSGKTAFLASISAQLGQQKIPHFVAPVETGDSDFVLRLLSALELKDLNTGDSIPMGIIQAILERHKAVLQAPIWISSYDNRVPISEMCQTLEYMVQNNGCRVALLDNLNFFMEVVSAADQLKEMDSAVHEFVMLVKKLPIHIILVVHPKKTDGGRVESEFDIKGSSTAVQECANVFLFNRPKAQDVERGEREWTQRDAIFKKIRKRGKYVNKPIWFEYDNGRYREIVENDTKPSNYIDRKQLPTRDGEVLRQPRPRPMASGARRD